MDTSQQIFEFRGVDNFYFAEVTKDDETGYTCGTPVHIPVQEVGKATDSSSEAHYYDNKAMIVVNSESADTITLVIAPPALDKLAALTGKSFDATTGMMVDSPRTNKYYAIMYRTKGTDGGYRYVSRLKGQFNIPDETSATEDDGTDTNNTSIEFTGIYTEHEFTKGKYNGSTWEKAGVKGIVVDARYGLADVSNFFSSVQTPDTIQASNPPAVTGIGVAPSSLTLVEGDTAQLEATLFPAGATGTITWSSSADTYAEVDEDGVVTAIAEGSATITATCSGKTDTCSVTVTAPSP
jgi:phi13 family phage major tail protein